MNPQKYTAADYSSREVEAARRVMNELAHVLGSYSQAMVVVGGWVPELLLPAGKPPHTGSIDVDILLNPKPLRGSQYASMLELLEKAGYKQAKEPFKLTKEIKVDNGEPIPVDVDFLLPKGAKTGGQGGRKQFRALDADGAKLALSNPENVKLDGRLPDNTRNLVEIHVASIEGFFIMKCHALAGRNKRKDAYDIYYCLLNAPGGPKEIAARLRPHLKMPEVKKGLALLADKFRDEGDFGPTSIVEFLDPEEDARKSIAVDAHRRVCALLKELRS
jgi:hypothetical protein